MWITDRIRKNKNVIGVFLGPTGSGKTYATLDLARNISKELGTNFTIDGNVAFNFADLIKKTQLPENDKPGSVFIFEEVGAAGSGAASSQWSSKNNASFNSFLQIIRCKNQILLFTTPNFGLLSKQDRTLCHFVAQMQWVNPQNNESNAKMFRVTYNSLYDKAYMKYLRINYKGTRICVKNTYFKLPPKEILEPYERAKKEFVDKFCKKVIEESEPREKAAKQPRITKDQLEQELKNGSSKYKIVQKYGLSNYNQLFHFLNKYGLKLKE